MKDQEVHIPAGRVTLEGNLTIPEGAAGLVLFAHGSGSSRHSPRNRFVARVLEKSGLATLLMDLLTASEEVVDNQTAELRFNIGLLAERLMFAADWCREQPATRALAIGLFGSSTGAAAALIAAADRADAVRAVVSRGGRPDLAGRTLGRVRAPTLLIVGGEDKTVMGLNEEAARRIPGEVKLEVVPGASHLFEEPGALETVSRLAGGWFASRLA
jgi:dienelactone hydrolase